jgi:hypothetical protein
MYGFSDWWDIIGTGVQSIFAWTTFNRDAFADNVGWRQNQKYQQKNYHISWISVARDDIRDMMSISVNRLNNFMIVNGLILGVAGSAITSASFNTNVSPFLVAAFLVSIATSIVFLVLAIMYGIKGQNCAFTNTMKLLTWEMRPENPADYNHDYMNQAQWIEKNGLLQMFRIPGIMPNYKTDPGSDDHLLPEHVKALKEQTAAKGQYRKPVAAKGDAAPGQSQEGSDFVAEDFTALEHLEVSSTSLWYLTKFGYFMRLWMPYDTHCKFSMGLGMLALGHAGAYFTMGTIISGGFDVPWYAAVGGSFSFVYMVALVVQQNFKEMTIMVHVITTILLCLGPTLGVYAATTKIDSLHKYLWMACFLFHFIFWSLTYVGTFSKKVLRASRLGAVGNSGGFWGQHETEHYSKHQGHRHKANHGKPASPGDVEVVGNGLVTPKGNHLASPKGKENPDGWSDSEDDSGSDTDSPSDGSTSYAGTPRRSDAYRYHDDGRGQASSSTTPAAPGVGDHSSLHGSHDKVISGTGRWPTDDPEFDEKVDDTSDRVRTALQQTIIVVAGVWVTLLIWVIAQAFVIDEESPFRRTYPSESVQVVSWPSPLFRPTRISCVEVSSGDMGPKVEFLSDDYRIFNLDGSDVTEASCNLSSTIRDLSSYCDGSCWPVVLTDDNRIVDCQSGREERLLQDSRAASLLTVYAIKPGRPLWEQKLVVSLADGKLLLYQWSKAKGGWVPEFELMSAEGATRNLVAIDASGDKLVLFHGSGADHLTVYRHDLKNMMPAGGPWALHATAAPLRHGCAYDRANRAMVLPKLNGLSDSRKVLRLDLANTHTAFTT